MYFSLLKITKGILSRSSLILYLIINNLYQNALRDSVMTGLFQALRNRCLECLDLPSKGHTVFCYCVCALTRYLTLARNR